MGWSWISIGGAKEVGGTCGMLRIDDVALLIDCGMRQHGEGSERFPDLAALPCAPDAVLLSHAHIDHTGALPLLLAKYPHLEVHATEPTKSITARLLQDSLRIMELQGGGAFGQEQVDALMAQFRLVAHAAAFYPIAGRQDIEVTYLLAGHIVGAVMMLIRTPYGTLLHANDFSVTNQRTVAGVRLDQLPEADIVITEGTYGSKQHPARKQQEVALADGVCEVLRAGGRVLFPAFGVGRSQELVLILQNFRKNMPPAVPMYLDGLVRSACDIYQEHEAWLNPALSKHLRHQRQSLFADRAKQTYKVGAKERARVLDDTRPAIIISSSGMLLGGPSVLYASRIIAEPKSAIAFSGYQDEDAPGAKLLAAQRGDTLLLDDTPYTIQCKTQRYNLSAHADGPQIAALVSHCKASLALLVHGQPEALESLATMIGRKAQVVEPLTTIDLPLGRFILGRETSAIRIAAAVNEPVTALACYEAVQFENHGIEPRMIWTVSDIALALLGREKGLVRRKEVEAVLQQSGDYFKTFWKEKTILYEPRTSEDVVAYRNHREWVQSMQPGRLVIAKAQSQHANAPQFAIVRGITPTGIDLLSPSDWKPGQPWRTVMFDTELQYPKLLKMEKTKAMATLTEWQKDTEVWMYDLLRLWQDVAGTTTLAAMAITIGIDAEMELRRLAWQVSTRGRSLWDCQQNQYTSLPLETVSTQLVGLEHHLSLVNAPAGSPVVIGEDKEAVLTGRSRWLRCQVYIENLNCHDWVRSPNLRLLDTELA